MSATAATERALRRQALLLKSAALRAELATQGAALAPLLGAADRVRAAVDWLKRHPLAVAGGALALAVARPRLLWRWARRALVGWRLAGDALAWLQRSATFSGPARH